jgi:hypothetical protein
MFDCIYCKEETLYIDGIDICHECYLTIHQIELRGVPQ